jgi:hypothetical protein
VLPGAEHLVLNCGHVPQLEQPKQTHAALIRFFSQDRADLEPAAKRRGASGVH